ncbi:MAG: hypothetical protein Q8O51_01900, partial [bacterium]|nr:hypothetical protein [bacterium]
MKSNRVLAVIVGSSGALGLAGTGALASFWPHVLETGMNATYAIAYACQAVFADLSRTRLVLSALGLGIIGLFAGWFGYTLLRLYRLSRPANLPLIVVPVAVLSIAADAGLDPSRVSVVRS